MTWHTASLVNNSGKAVSGNGSQKGDKGGAGVIEVQGYGEVVIRDKGWNDKYDAWAVQIGSNAQVWTYQGEGQAHFQIDDATSIGDGIYLTLASEQHQEGPPNVGPGKVMAEVLPPLPQITVYGPDAFTWRMVKDTWPDRACKLRVHKDAGYVSFYIETAPGTAAVSPQVSFTVHAPDGTVYNTDVMQPPVAASKGTSTVGGLQGFYYDLSGAATTLHEGDWTAYITDTDATGGWTAVGSAGPTNYKEAAKTAVANLATKDSRAITASFTGGNKDIRPQESTFEACALCHVQVLALGGLFAATFAWWAAAAGAVAPATLGTLEGYLAQLFPDTPAAAIAKKITEWKGYYSAGMSIKDIVWEVCTWEGMCTGA